MISSTRTAKIFWVTLDGGYACGNHVFQIWWRSVQRFSVGWGSDFAISNWLWRSSLQHSHTTVRARNWRSWPDTYTNVCYIQYFVDWKNAFFFGIPSPTRYDLLSPSLPQMRILMHTSDVVTLAVVTIIITVFCSMWPGEGARDCQNSDVGTMASWEQP